ncbi:MAG: methylmalonyl-CoA mutase subunit beta, partial [Psychroserpens sp.]|nr:methylmalonyl-CoA mutase subunit beta [Psychroserpens sp.]
EGIDVKPFYHSDEFHATPLPSHTTSSAFKITQSIVVEDNTNANVKALDAINRGAEAIIFEVNSKTMSLDNLVKGIDLEKNPVHINLNVISESILDEIKGNSKYSLGIDIIGNLARTGNWYSSLKEDHRFFEAFVSKSNTVTIDLALYQNAGANIVQQLAYSISHLNEYFNHFDGVLTSDQKKELNVVFNVSVGTNYFFEIAKLRALRSLHTSLAKAYSMNPSCSIHATPTKRNKTLYDYNTNMLRTTTECMSAVLGGADWIANQPYDAIYHKTNEFGERISRNQLLILKNESYFDKVDNPTDGAYYIISLSTQLSEKALDIVKSMEASGGFLSQLKEGTIQKKIKESANKEQGQFETSELVLLGTNKYPNPDDKMKDNLEIDPFLKYNPIKTLIEPILEKRLAETIEQERLKTE